MSFGSRSQVVTGAILIAAFIGALSVATYIGLTHNVPGANDFYVPWRATQALFVEGRNPYGADVTRDIQIGMFGHPRTPTEHQFAFAYPLMLSLLLSPLALLPYDAAEAIWLSLCLVVLVVAIFMLVGKQSPPILAGYVLFGLIFYPAARSLILGQYAIIAFGATVVMLWAMDRDKRFDALSGAMLALAALKPQVIFLTAPLIVAWAWRQQRRMIVLSFLMTLASLSAIALLILPQWPLDFIDSLRAYDAYVEPNSPTAILFGNSIATIVADVLLVGLLFWVAWRQYRQGFPKFVAVVGWSLIVAQVVATRTSTTNQMMMLIPIIIWLKVRPVWQQLVGMALLLVVPWAVFAATIHGNEEQPPTFLAVPLVILVLFLVPWLKSLRLIPRVANAL